MSDATNVNDYFKILIINKLYKNIHYQLSTNQRLLSMVFISSFPITVGVK